MTSGSLLSNSCVTVNHWQKDLKKWDANQIFIGTHNAARRLLDGVSSLSTTVSSISTAPSRSVSGWLADRIAPSYWRPNADITNCHLCDRRLNQKIHHCRACGEGFCDACSDFKRPVPERGWGVDEPVRVCRDCYGPLAAKKSRSEHHVPTSHLNEENVNARKYGEKVMGTLNNFATVVLDYPLSALKDSARPAYWVPDEECAQCCVCQSLFDLQLSSSSNSVSSSTGANNSKAVKLHHCRQCGQGVCDDCSRGRKPVVFRGWDTPVRVCDACINVDLSS